MQAVVDQQHRRGRLGLTGVAGELARVGQPRRPLGQIDEQLSVRHLETGGIGVGARRQRRSLVEELARIGDHLVATNLVIARPLFGAVAFRNDVGAVQRVIQRAPASIGRVQREPRVEDRHHQLRAGGRRDFVVDAGGGDGEVTGFGQQVTDFSEELAVSVHVERLDHAVPVPLVDLGL